MEALTDTTPEAEEVQLELLRRAPAWRKLEMTFVLNRALKRLMMANIDAGSLEGRHRAFAERCLGSDLAAKVYGSPPSPPGSALEPPLRGYDSLQRFGGRSFS